MDILVRKIQLNNNGSIFKPNSKAGFKFDVHSAQPSLTPFQIECVQTKRQRDKKMGSFWTPDVCIFGEIIVANGSVNLSEVLDKKILFASVEKFNSYFPERKHYWYNKAKPNNIAMQTYFVGLRVVASLLAYYYDMQKSANIIKANEFYKKYLIPLRLAKLMEKVDDSLISISDFTYNIVSTGDDYRISPKSNYLDLNHSNEASITSTTSKHDTSTLPLEINDIGVPANNFDSEPYIPKLPVFSKQSDLEDEESKISENTRPYTKLPNIKD